MSGLQINPDLELTGYKLGKLDISFNPEFDKDYKFEDSHSKFLPETVPGSRKVSDPDKDLADADLLLGVNQFLGDLGYASAVERAYKYNADLEARKAKDALLRGQDRIRLAKRRAKQVRGAQRVSYAAGNIALDSEVVSAVQESSDLQAEEDYLAIRTTAIREAENHHQRAANNRRAALLARQGANRTAFNSLLEGAKRYLASNMDRSNRFNA